MLQRPTLPQILPPDRYSFVPARSQTNNIAQARPWVRGIAQHESVSIPASSVPFPAVSTPFPNLLLEKVMPELSDTEWRLLCVVVRQTLGFVSLDGKGRRSRDWLTHRQLKSRTGRASAAVSRGIDGLVRKGLIEVRSLDGRLLLTPAERRRWQGALFFSLAPRLVRDADADRANVVASV